MCCSSGSANGASRRRRLIDQTDTPIYSGGFVGNWSWSASGALNVTSYPQTGVDKADGLCFTLTNPGVSVHILPLVDLSVLN